MSYHLGVKIEPHRYKHFKVEEAVYNYVRQLEHIIKHNLPKDKIAKLYPERFYTNEEIKDLCNNSENG